MLHFIVLVIKFKLRINEGNDSNAQIHLKREIEFHDVWEIKANKSEADFEVKLLTNKTGIANADREVRVIITDLKTGKEFYSSPIVRGTDYGFRTVNLKEAAIKNLVENEIRTSFLSRNIINESI